MINIRAGKGFTLIELMIVIAIIGILAAIAVPQFTAYRKRANDSAALAQVRGMATAEEAYFAEHGQYTTALTDLENYGFKKDAQVTRTRQLIDKTGAASTSAYQLTATHMSGSGKIFIWKSDNGGLQ